MKKIIFTLLIAMLAACGQQSSNSAVGGDPNDSQYTVKITTSQDELRKDDEKIIASVQVVRNGGSLLTAQEVQGLNLVFMVDKGLIYEPIKDKPLDFSVYREADSKILGDLKLTASIDDAEVAVKTIKVVRGHIEFLAVPDSAFGGDTIPVNVRLSDIGEELSKHKLTAFVDGKEAGSGLTDKEGKAKFNVALTNDSSEDVKAVIKIAQSDIGLENEHKIIVKPAIKEGLKLQLVHKKTQKVAQGLLVGTSTSAKAAYQLKISSIGNSVKDGSQVFFKSSKIDVNFSGSKNTGKCTLVAGTCSVDISNETTGQAYLTASAGSMQTGISIDFVPSIAKSMELIASPKAINERDTKFKKSSYSSTIIVRLLAEDSANPSGPGVGVPNKKVKFLLPNENYGSFEPASNEAITDSQGYATITYVAPTTVQLVEVKVAHVRDDNSTLEGKVNIDVQKRHLAIAVGYGTTIKVVDSKGVESEEGEFYLKSLTIVVTDNTGKSINGAQVKVTSKLSNVETGCLVWQGKEDQGEWKKPKDTEAAGKEMAATEDLTSGLTISAKGLNDERSEFETQNNGVVQIDLRYLRRYAWWATSNIRINASFGNQAANVDAVFSYPLAAENLGAKTPDPANRYSPYNEIFPSTFNISRCEAKEPPPSPKPPMGP